MKFKRNGARGSAAIFLCIILSALILSESILFAAALQRGIEANLQRCMRLQLSQILSNYNKPLLEHYGLYGLNTASLDSKVFSTCFPDAESVSLDASLAAVMTVDELKTAISDYMRVRMPALASNAILSRLKSVCSEIRGSDIFKIASCSDSSAWLSYLKDILAQKSRWSDVIGQAAAFLGSADFTGTLAEFTEFCSTVQQTAERRATLFLQGDADSEEVLNTENLSGILGILDSYVSCDMPDAADALMVQAYAVSFFDSKVESVSAEGTSGPEKNVLGIPYSDIHATNKADLEYILTGVEEESISFCMVKILIVDARTAINFGTFLLDQQKMAKAKEIAEILSAVIAVISAGTVDVDPQVLEYVVLYAWALEQAITEMASLVSGESIQLFTNSAMPDNEILDASLATDYRDYAGLFLMAVPVDWKLSRILAVLERDTGGEVFTGVRLHARYNGCQFRMEDTYDAYQPAE